jgi:hypothetical protein
VRESDESPRDGKIISIKFHNSWREALEAAGLRR